jgi:PAS domain S-box-containing protein
MTSPLEPSSAFARDRQALLEATLESTADGILVVDEAGQVVHANSRFAELWRIPDELLAAGDDARLLAHVLDQLAQPEAFLAKVEDLYGTDREDLDTIAFADGRVFERYSRPLLREGSVAGRVWSFRDITQRHQAETRLRLDEARLRALAQLSGMAEASVKELTDFAMEAGVSLTNSTMGYLAFMNEDETVLTMYSWSKTAMAQCSILDKPIVYPVATTGLWGEAVRQRRPVVTNDYAAPSPLKRGCPAGHVPVRRHMNVPVFDGSRIVAVAGVGNKEEPYDESDVVQLQLLMDGMWRLIHRRQATEALQEAHDELEHRVTERTAELARSNAELEQFAYAASHDLQEPLRKIQAFGDRLRARSGEALDAEARDYLERMQGAAQRMSGLINDLLAYSRVTTQAQPFVLVDLGEVIRGVLSNLEVAVEQTGATVEIGALPAVEADPTQMHQLLQNLLSNALKFRRPGTAPVVSVTGQLVREADPEAPEIQREFCQIVVQDNGIGFDERFSDRIFGVFQRLHSREEYAGSGIGLALCRKIAERHGGTVEASSAPGQGAKFTVRLPVRHSTGGDTT